MSAIVLALILLFTLVVYWLTRGSGKQLRHIREAAAQLVAGEANVQAVDPDSSGEFGDLAWVLNRAIGEATNRRQQTGLDQKLLRMLAEERASQLSQREQELSKADEEISATREELHRLANYDRLTSLPNRQFFTEQLELLLRICARNGKPLGLLLINLDDFHRINESLGRTAGDELLKVVGKRLVSCVRSSDMLSHYISTNEELNISRLGGDEFAVVLSQLDSIDSAGLVAQRVIDNICQPMTVNDQEVVVNASIGIAMAPRNSMQSEELLKAASIAMHIAKAEHGSGFLFYKEDMQPVAQDDLKMESELRKALERNELRLHFQPQVDTSDGSIICAEAFLRWEHPEFGQVAPIQFIGLAEKIGIIWELGDWVLVEACRRMQGFREQGLELARVAINVSPQQFKPEFVDRVQDVLTATGLPPDALELGLSEEILMDNDSNVARFLRELKETGVYLSLENFGTNHAPISYLGRHSLDEIKIDRSFVKDCDQRSDAGRLVQAIIAMAKSLELRTVAEGVETEGEYRFLARHGVTVMRGYLFSKPVPDAQLREMLVVPWHFMTQLQRMALTAQ